jgi:hypothetical protein
MVPAVSDCGRSSSSLWACGEAQSHGREDMGEQSCSPGDVWEAESTGRRVRGQDKPFQVMHSVTYFLQPGPASRQLFSYELLHPPMKLASSWSSHLNSLTSWGSSLNTGPFFGWHLLAKLLTVAHSWMDFKLWELKKIMTKKKIDIFQSSWNFILKWIKLPRKQICM